MHIDIHTLAILLSLSNLMQVGALYTQYRVDNSHAGPGWWTLGTAAVSIAFAFNYLRDAPAVGPFAIVANNMFFIVGLCLLYVGVRRFLGQPVAGTKLLVLCAIVTLGVTYFTFVHDNWPVRRMFAPPAISLISFLTAKDLLVHRLRPGAESSYLLATAFLFVTGFVGLRGLATFIGTQLDGMFGSSAAYIYVCSLISTTTWTFGFILLVNQRLKAERQTTIQELQTAIEQIRTLRGILPICAHCKKIRNDTGFWEQVDAYVSRHTEAEFSHGICPECMQLLDPD